jgi:hypothetical protein
VGTDAEREGAGLGDCHAAALSGVAICTVTASRSGIHSRLFGGNLGSNVQGNDTPGGRLSIDYTTGNLTSFLADGLKRFSLLE